MSLKCQQLIKLAIGGKKKPCGTKLPAIKNFFFLTRYVKTCGYWSSFGWTPPRGSYSSSNSLLAEIILKKNALLWSSHLVKTNAKLGSSLD